jgi:hypothetical protein
VAGFKWVGLGAVYLALCPQFCEESTVNDADDDTLALAQTEFQAGQRAFEAGEYGGSVQYLERAYALVEPGTRLHGDVQIWLVTAYEAAGQRDHARELCQLATHHPHWETRKMAKRLLYILEAPALQRRSDWLTAIPDLSAIEATESRDRGGTMFQPRSPARPTDEMGYIIPNPTDSTEVTTEDKAFIWVALAVVLLVIGGIVWWSY